jgi:CheY-like chemotaxis protein
MSIVQEGWFRGFAPVNELQHDVLLLDVEMPLLNGIEVARQLKKAGRIYSFWY